MNAPLSDFRRNNFDVIRILAATQVLLFHAFARLHVDVPAALQWLVHIPGVPIFFVTSGLLVSASLERQQTDLGRYFKNRLLRIYPGLWACITITLLVVLAFGYRMHTHSDVAWYPLQLAGLIYTPGFLHKFGSGTYNGALWTIPVELQFYFALPAAYFLARRTSNPRRAMVLIFLAFAALAALLAHFVPTLLDPVGYEMRWAKVLRYSFVPRFYLFLLGVLLQQFKAYEHPVIRGKAWAWAIVYAALVFLVPRNAVTEVVQLMTLGVLTVSVAYTNIGFPEHWLKNRDISYGVYIYHGLIINILVELGLTGRPWMMLVVLFGAYTVGALSWFLLEKPVLTLKKRRLTPVAA